MRAPAEEQARSHTSMRRVIVIELAKSPDRTSMSFIWLSLFAPGLLCALAASCELLTPYFDFTFSNLPFFTEQIPFLV
jgi:hypothetical protein